MTRSLLLSLSLAAAVPPVLFFPGYSFSRLRVNVTGGTVNGCPSDGTFEAEFTGADTINGFNQDCQFQYLEVKNTNNDAPFANRADVKIDIPGRTTGSTTCLASTLYDDLINYFITRGGYTKDTTTSTFLAACYDWRMDPSHDVIGGPSFVANTQNLVMQAYNVSQERVWLVGHSNGPIMALYFLNQMTDTFKRTYIAGFIPISGNFAGQGLFPVIYSTGLVVTNFTFLPSTAAIHRGWTQNYFSGPQPAVFQGVNSLTFCITDNPPASYDVTVSGLNRFFNDSGNTFGLLNWQKYAGLVGPHTLPQVFTFALWGANISTLYGLHFESFQNPLNISEYLMRSGDINQEDIDNESPLVWAEPRTAPGCFKHWQVENVDHFALSSTPIVMQTIYDIIHNTTWKDCTIYAPTPAPTKTPTMVSAASHVSVGLGLVCVAFLGY